MIIPIICCVLSMFVGLFLGSLAAGDYARKSMWNINQLAGKQAELILKFQEAAKPIIEEIEAAGEDTDWSDGPETHRVCYWHEIEPLAKVLKESQQ